jgi:methylenetetrahydrofolate--tRNA-(uracil-5-)-methyltransferase
LVCSNSLKSESENTAPWLLKQEMRRAGSFLLRDADASAVPAGHALAVDRVEFSRRVAARIEAAGSGEAGRITVHREEVTALDESDPDILTILATGPLTSPALTAELTRLTGSDHLAFYDSISPIVDASTIDMAKVYFAARYDKGTADYINCPFTKEEYDRFLDALVSAEAVEPKAWEQIPTSPEPRTSSLELRASNLETVHYFEGCLPIEETARRGRDTLRFGPMKPVGLTDPKTGRWSSFARKTCAPTATTSSASKII